VHVERPGLQRAARGVRGEQRRVGGRPAHHETDRMLKLSKPSRVWKNDLHRATRLCVSRSHMPPESHAVGVIEGSRRQALKVGASDEGAFQGENGRSPGVLIAPRGCGRIRRADGVGHGREPKVWV
jgi:hypothetical protein